MRKTRILAAFTLLAMNACGGAAGEAPMAKPPAEAAAGAMMASPDSPAPAAYPGVAAPGAPAGAPISPADTKAGIAAPAAQGAPAAAGAKTAADAPRPTVDQMIVYTGQLEMLVDQGKESPALDQVVDVAESFGGHLAGRTNTSVVVKVPSAHFREAMSKLEPLGEVVNRNVSAEDVTEAFHDAQVRLENLRATRARLQEFLNRAGNIQDTLTVEHELERVAQEMDVLEGKVAFMKDRSTWSQITVAVQPKPKVEPMVKQLSTPPPPPPPKEARLLDLPVDWIDQIGIDQLLKLK